MSNNIYGYIRVSTKDQNEDRQRIAMQEAGVPQNAIFSDKQSGKNFQWRMISKERQVGIVVLDIPLLDTRQGKDLTGTLIADIVLQLLSYLAQIEREFILQRQAEGIAAAKRRGVHFGREPMERPSAYYSVYQEWKTGKLSARAAARALGISHTTFLRWSKEAVNQSTPCIPEPGDLDDDH